jgi:hypothetical protein
MSILTIESGSSFTAIGPDQIRTETWETKIDSSKKAAEDPGITGPTTAGTYGYNNSSRLQYTLVFCANVPQMLCTGAVTTHRRIDLSCCAP